ncbi:hypothetical protein EJB05_24314, partial [Eragrostis curvula]
GGTGRAGHFAAAAGITRLHVFAPCFLSPYRVSPRPRPPVVWPPHRPTRRSRDCPRAAAPLPCGEATAVSVAKEGRRRSRKTRAAPRLHVCVDGSGTSRFYPGDRYNNKR